MRNVPLSLVFGCLLGLAGCQQSVFPDEPLDPKKAVTYDLTHYELVFEEIMEFPEGKTTQYKINAKVPEPGLPLIAVEQLPEGASFDSANQTFSWTPPLSQQSGKPFRTKRFYLHLTSTLNPHVTLHRTAMALAYREEAREE